jgi:hypothetical protein
MIPREIKEMILKQLYREGAGMIRQVNREWRDIIDGLLIGGRKQGLHCARKITLVTYVMHHVESVRWARIHNIPNIRRFVDNYTWRHSPLAVIEYLIEQRVLWLSSFYLHNMIVVGRFEDVRFLSEKYKVGFLWSSVVMAGDTGRVDIVKWMMGVLKTHDYKYFGPDVYRPYQYILKETLQRTDNCIVLKEFVDHGVSILKDVLTWVKQHQDERPNTLQIFEDNTHRIEWVS